MFLEKEEIIMRDIILSQNITTNNDNLKARTIFYQIVNKNNYIIFQFNQWQSLFLRHFICSKSKYDS